VGCDAGCILMIGASNALCPKGIAAGGERDGVRLRAYGGGWYGSEQQGQQGEDRYISHQLVFHDVSPCKKNEWDLYEKSGSLIQRQLLFLSAYRQGSTQKSLNGQHWAVLLRQMGGGTGERCRSRLQTDEIAVHAVHQPAGI